MVLSTTLTLAEILSKDKPNPDILSFVPSSPTPSAGKKESVRTTKVKPPNHWLKALQKINEAGKASI